MNLASTTNSCTPSAGVMNPLCVVVNDCATVGGACSAAATADLIDDFEPLPRDRCNTWPLQKPAGDLGHHISPLMHEDIPEECDDDDLSSTDSASCYQSNQLAQINFYSGTDSTVGLDFNQCRGAFQTNSISMSVNDLQQSVNKKNSSRRNAWGNLSYADLITNAINSMLEKRMTLAQVYDWFLHNVPYFRDKGDSNSSAGWKNSIRHNLSLHSRFVRVQNEGAGKSSWWMLNPDAKPGKSSRRRTGSIEQPHAVKFMEKKRGRAKKKVDVTMVAAGTLQDMYPGSNACSSTSINRLGSPSIDSTSLSCANVDFKPDFMDDVPPPNSVRTYMPGLVLDRSLMDFRPRTASSVSDYLPSTKTNCGQISPKVGLVSGMFEEWDYGVNHMPAPTTCSEVEETDLINTLSTSMGLGPDSAVNGDVRHRLQLHPSSYHSCQQQARANGFGDSSATSDTTLECSVVEPNRPSPDHDQCIQARNGGSDTSQNVKQHQPVIMNGYSHRSASVTIKTEPPAYQDLYPARHTRVMNGSSISNCGNGGGNNPMLRDALQQRILSNQRPQQNGNGRRSLSSSPNQQQAPPTFYTPANHERAPSSPDSSTSPAFVSSMSFFNGTIGPTHAAFLRNGSVGQSVSMGMPNSTASFLMAAAAGQSLLYNMPAISSAYSAGRPPWVGGVGGSSNGMKIIQQHAHHHGYHPYQMQQLPKELSDINYDDTSRNTFNYDMAQVMRDLSDDGSSLEFTGI